MKFAQLTKINYPS